MPLGSDAAATSHYLLEFMKAFSEGDRYPRWTDGTNQGFGAPSFVMFPPLTYYGAGAASWLMGSLTGGFKLYLVAVSLLSALAFYGLAREWVGRELPAALAAGAYLLLPYRVLEVYQRFALSEATAFVFFPLILLFARRVMDSASGWALVGLAASYAGLLYTHLVSALLFSLLLGIWLPCEAGLRWRRLLPAAAGLACGLALAAPALLPAVVEKSAANIAWSREMPNGDFRVNFIFRDDVLRGLRVRDPVKPPVLKAAHSQLLLACVAAGVALVWLPREGERRRRQRRDVGVLLAGCGLAYGMQLELSTPIWRIVPELASVQFPWRFQTQMVLTTALLVGFALAAVGPTPRPAGSAAGSAALAVVAVVNLGLSWQNAHLKPFRLHETGTRSASVASWIEPALTPREFEPYRTFKTTRYEMPRAAFAHGEGEVGVTRWASSSRVLDVTSAGGGTVRLRSFWFPGWTATLSGAPLPLRPTPHLGVISFDVPAGRSVVALRFTDTPVRRLASAIGLVAWPVTAALAWLRSRVATHASA